jgi:glycosyltransferase involved in cell wall biosynthesis
MESFGLAALEAMACEVPTVGTNVGGVPEVVTDGETGMLFGVGEVDAMAQAAITLLNDPARLAAMGKAGRRFAQQNFCSTRIVPQYEAYYAKILG